MARVDCIVMAGGRGSRLGGAVKPLLEVCGKSIIERMLGEAWRVCRRVILVYSSHTRGLEVLCRSGYPLECIKGSGESYVEDLKHALMLASLPALVLPADMPFITWMLLEDFLVKALSSPAPIVNLSTPRGPSGVSLFKEREGAWEDVEYPWSHQLLDVDEPGDLEEAERSCS